MTRPKRGELAANAPQVSSTSATAKATSSSQASQPNPSATSVRSTAATMTAARMASPTYQASTRRLVTRAPPAGRTGSRLNLDLDSVSVRCRRGGAGLIRAAHQPDVEVLELLRHLRPGVLRHRRAPALPAHARAL